MESVVISRLNDVAMLMLTHLEKLVEFNISRIRGGHPLLNVIDLSIEASQSLGLLLDELRLPMVNSLSNSMIIVLINSLSAIAKKRPSFYGRILPVLLGLEPSSFVNKGFRVSGAHHGLKNAFISCLNCTHPGDCTFLHSLLRQTRTKSKLPPGPGRLPVVGNLLKLGDKPHKSLAGLAETYGPIMSLKLGQITTVVISSPALAKEALQKQDLAFSSRSIPNAVHAHEQYKYSVVWLPVSDKWRSLRKILNSNIFSVDIGSAAFTTSLNLLSNTIFSVDLADLCLDSAKELRDLVWNVMMETGKPNLVNFFPVLAMIDPQGIRNRVMVHLGKILQLFGGLIDERLKSRKLHKSNAENDVIDILLNLNQEIDRTHIERTDTTSSTVEWAMAELLRNPECLKKAKAELEQTIGKGKPIQERDTSQLPYLQAIVKETLRIHPSVPFLIPRKVETDVEIYGYTVPKGAQVLVNVWAIGRDPSIWKNPTTFMPERFLELDIDVRGHDFELIPFGAGRRICPGLPLAMRTIPAVLGSLINSFDWKIEGGVTPEELDMEDKFGITLQKAQPLRVVPFYTAQKDQSFHRARGRYRSSAFGNLLQLGDKPHKSLAELAKIHVPHVPIMSLKLGADNLSGYFFISLSQRNPPKARSGFSPPDSSPVPFDPRIIISTLPFGCRCLIGGVASIRS
ncbi:hypothetical protein Vadar_030192 [Vaccinium darrowii]|uniref:Uncharacterized protein n=1 Tax=Vaccinium darrowii TaxID=229202 RepID=A0ACB7XL58_9ERIC|nr:hypothetical protein Vadar_030192 [Vaccinium darrowii]